MEGFKNKYENTFEHSVLLDIVKRAEELSERKDLTPAEINKESKELVEELLLHLKEDLHLELSDDVSSIYNEMSKEHVLARVESLTKVIECVVGGEYIHVGSGERHYANSVTADPEGLRIAMAEAEAMGPVRLLVGLDVKTLIGFKNDHLEVTEIEDNEFDMRDTGLRKTVCRHISGDIHSEDIKYLVMRIPRGLFPSEEMTPEELEGRSGGFIFRGTRLSRPGESYSESDTRAAA